MKTIHIFYIALFAAFALWLSSATAEISLVKPTNVTGPYSAYFPAGQTGFAITNGSTLASGSGVTVNASGVAVAVKNGSHIKIPVSLSTLVPKGDTALIALRAFKIARGLAGPVGLALTAFEIYNIVKDSGVATCPPPDHFCTAAMDVPVPALEGGYKWAGGSQMFPSAAEACNAYFATLQAANQAYFISLYPVFYANGQIVCLDKKGNSPVMSLNLIPFVCPDGATTSNTGCTSHVPAGAAPDSVIESKVTQAINADASGLAAKRAWDAAESLNEIARANGHAGVPTDVMMPATAQTTMTAPPVTTPQVTTSTQQFNDANGVPQTRTSQESSTITPVKSGNGTSTNVSYNVRNVTTTTVTNNTSQSTSNPPSTTTTTDDSKLEMPPDSGPSVDLPKDYNREVTQQAIAADIKAMRNACQDNPRRAGCAEFDVPPVAEAIPRKEVPITYTPTLFASAASCPAPIEFDMYGARQIAFTPMCDLMTKLRPLFLACAAAGAALIFMRGLKS